jgi:exosortase/archaeosortase family protein
MSINLYQKKLALWLLTSLFVVSAFPAGFWSSLKGSFTVDYIINQHNVAPVGMVFLCAAFLFSKRKEIKERMAEYADKYSFIMIAAGFLLAAISWLLPWEKDYLLLKTGYVLTGSFVAIFSRAAKLPIIILGISTFVVFFPVVIQRYAEVGYAQSVILPVKIITDLLRFPLTVNGQLLSFTTALGDSITVMLTGACAGPATMGVFIGIFALMLLDMPVSHKRTLILLIVGLAGTWIQNIIRVLILLGSGYGYGKEALWAAHTWTIYILFPVWYLIFAAIYFKNVHKG